MIALIPGWKWGLAADVPRATNKVQARALGYWRVSL